MDVIETARLRLRPFTQDDARALFELFRLPEVARWSGTGTPMTDVSEASERIARMPERAGDHPAAGLFATEVAATGAFAGMLLLVPLRPSAGNDRQVLEVGWHLHPDHWGHGYATEGAQEVLRHGFETLGVERIVAYVVADNHASVRVVEKLGMRHVGSADWHGLEDRCYERRRA